MSDIFKTITAIIVILFCGAYWVFTQNGLVPRVEALEAKQNNQKNILDRMDYNVQIIAQKIGVEPLKKPDDEP